jgi:hypothetical protein
MRILIIPYGWMGDTIFATSIARMIKSTNPSYEVDFYLEHLPMKDFILNIPNIDNVVDSSEGYDRIFKMPHTNIFENPIETYMSSIDIKIDNIVFESIPSSNNSPINYITYQSDWQNRTKLDISYIITHLEKQIECIPVGKNTSIGLGDQNENKLLFNKTVKQISNSKMNLGMLGGINVLSSYLGIPTFTTLDHHYNSYPLKNISSNDFYKKIKILPSIWTNNPIHFEHHPDITEDELIEFVLDKIDKI